MADSLAADMQDPGRHPVSAVATGSSLPLCPGVRVPSGGLGSSCEDLVTPRPDGQGQACPQRSRSSAELLGLTSPSDWRVGRLA